jgi:tight adherence protein B
MTPLMISLLAFLGVTALVGLVMFVLADNSGMRMSDRLDTLTGKRKREDESASILRHTAFENDKRSLLAMFAPRLLSLQKLFLQADGLMFFMTPWAWLLNKRRVRLKAFGAQLPDALELVARALRAGHSLAAGLHVVGEEMPSPISDEFNRVYEEQNLGIPIEDALKSMCDRVPNLDLRFFVTSVLIQRQTGGDLSEILDKIGYVIRERFRILGQVQALTAEGRLSGVILIALPFGLFLMMLYIKPDYIERLWTHPLGVKMSIFALIAQLVGAVVIKKIVNIKV